MSSEFTGGRQAARRLRTNLVAVASSLLLVSACGGSEPPAPIKLAPRAGQWMISADSPVIRAGDFRDKALWNDPCVLKTPDGYVMYLTSSTKEPFKPPVLPFRAVSQDGIAWHLAPAEPLLDASGTAFVSIETPSVVVFHNTWHLYYSGIHPPGHVPAMEIGHAVSVDGIHWRKDPAPVIRASGKVTDWTGYAVAEPGAVVFNDRILVYFAAVGARPSGSPPQLESIGVATSTDGSSFDAPRVVLSQGALYAPEAGFPGYSTPAALVDGAVIHLFYDVVHFQKGARPEWRQVALQHAVSTDGGVHFVEDNGPLLGVADAVWASNGEVSGPSALIDGETVKLWFGSHAGYDELGNMMRRGWKGSEFGIGYATTKVSLLRDAIRK